MSGNIACIDIGTSNYKLTLYSPEGKNLRVIQIPTPLIRRKPGFYEQSSEQMMNTVRDLFSEAGKYTDKLAGVTVTGMAQSEAPIDRSGKPITDFKCWLDRRAEPYLDFSIIREKPDLLQQIPTFRYIPYLLLWYRDHEPNILKQSVKWVEAVDFVAASLAGTDQYRIDYSHACRTLLFDAFKEKWNQEIADVFNVDLAYLPQIAPSGTLLGTLQKKWCPWSEGTPVFLGGHDHACGALAGGLHADKEGFVINTTGTSEAIIAPLDSNVLHYTATKTNAAHHITKGYVNLVGYVCESGNIMKWANRLFDLYEFEKHNDFLARYKERHLIMPYYLPTSRQGGIGEKAGFTDVVMDNEGDDFCLSIMEGVVFDYTETLKRTCRAAGVTPKGVRVTGGLSKLKHLMTLKASAINTPVYAYPETDFAALGSYMICRKSLNPSEKMEDIQLEALSRETPVMAFPDPVLYDLMQERYEHYLDRAGELKSSVFD